MSVLQTKAGLAKASAISLITALIALVLFILPAEYNIDPTGVGAKLGLIVFHESEASSQQAPSEASMEDAVVVTVPAGRGIEYKLYMTQFQTAKYQWQAVGGELYFDLHGEPEGDTSDYFESYAIATSDEMQGQFTAPFTGSHGWYWRNKTEQDIKVQLKLEGQYQVEGIKH